MQHIFKHIILSAVTLTMVYSETLAQQKIKVASKGTWTKMYEEYATFRCICEATDNEILPLLFKNNDLSFRRHLQKLGTQARYADKFGRNFAKNVKVISTDSLNDLYNYKLTLWWCLQMSERTALDSIANARYKIFLNQGGSLKKQKLR